MFDTELKCVRFNGHLLAGSCWKCAGQKMTNGDSGNEKDIEQGRAFVPVHLQYNCIKS